MKRSGNSVVLMLVLLACAAPLAVAQQAGAKINPRNAEALNDQGILYARENRNAEAKKLFQEALDQDPEYVQAMVNLGLTLAAEGDYQNAQLQFQNALRREPNNASALTSLGMLQGKTGQRKEAVNTFQKLTKLYPDSADAHLNLGMALGDTYELQGALAEFSEASRLSPNSPLAHYNQGRALYTLNRLQESRKELERAVQLSPDYVDALFLLGVIEHSSPKATELFAKVVKLQPANADALFYLGRNLLEAGKEEQAIELWKRAVEADPENVAALSSLARSLKRAGSPDAPKYAAQLHAVQQRWQIHDQVKLLNDLALEAAGNNDWQQAIDSLKQAIDLCGQCSQLATLHKDIGFIYARQGDMESATRELRTALTLLPNGPEASAVGETLRKLASRPALPAKTP